MGADEAHRVVVGERERHQKLHRRSVEREGELLRREVRAERSDLARDDLGHGREQSRAVHDRADLVKRRDRDAHAAREAERILDDASEVAVVRDHDVVFREVALARERARELRATRVVKADEPAVEEGLARDAGGQFVGDGDREVDRSGDQRVRDRAELDWQDEDAHARRLALERTKKRGQEPSRARVRETEADRPVALARIERTRRERRGDERGEMGPRGVQEPRAARGEREPTTPAHEQGRADRGGEALERGAHGGLRQVEP